ncbi:type II toxin-antitoxin system Phd/YefM family antitoxin [Candidatus Roizmanbacteria bacterium CG_4_9_14_0_2_um_filter_39_13]|uniref:Antitoxin n=1 Tax=Candidatus Roizmanbacteria bacterium CG_4_9_14_0_2_um_filter_39_13 TaxID=1974839 RepID=A0A2M8EWF9_9BACT|nr:MAG: type II toxin-antitoxin system Phd/YefM family antitoxin [Candidatus Roizmanbacteria bacterium CG_4_10_14_0_2_um_filter_39_12]PJC30202.1 MAG: type II toxin-antitoxin system Phd/YefM family antitoxin [Candidatus Roizmanbacteria bacterium CG_4_9_14_0_2_um_filter_39_13]
MQTLPITEARKDLTSLVNDARNKLNEYVITVNGSPAAVLISATEYDSWKETMEIMADPTLMAAIREGEEDIKAGRYYDWEDVKKELGLNDVQDKNNS